MKRSFRKAREEKSSQAKINESGNEKESKKMRENISQGVSSWLWYLFDTDAGYDVRWTVLCSKLSGSIGIDWSRDR